MLIRAVIYTHIQCMSCFVDSQVNITLVSEHFTSDGVVVTLEWIQQNFYSYNVSVIPQPEYDVNETTRIQLNVSYNTFYNMNVVASPPCGQNTSTSNLIGLYYCKYTIICMLKQYILCRIIIII